MSREERTHRRAATLAARQYGVITREQLAGIGYSGRMIEGALRGGRLQAWHRDVFAVGQGTPSPHGLCMAAILFRGEDALISFQSAIWLWGLERKLEIPVNVSVRGGDRSDDEVGLHLCPDLREDDSARNERLPVTSVPRTLLDYASTAATYRLESAIDRADRLELLDPVAVDLITAEVPGHHGANRLRRAMSVYREHGLPHSGGEERMLTVLADAGVERPAVNGWVEGHEVDFFWEDERFAVELDSGTHRTRRASEADRERREELAAAGVETIRITGTRLRHEPDRVARRIAEQLDRRRERRS